MRLILLFIIIMVVADAAYSRTPFDTEYIYQNEEIDLSGKPTITRVFQWAEGTTAKTTVDVSVRTCVQLTEKDLRIDFISQGPLNHLRVKSAVQNVACASPQILKFQLRTNLIRPIELADIKVGKKKLVLWVYSNRAPYGSGVIL